MKREGQLYTVVYHIMKGGIQDETERRTSINVSLEILSKAVILLKF